MVAKVVGHGWLCFIACNQQPQHNNQQVAENPLSYNLRPAQLIS